MLIIISIKILILQEKTLWQMFLKIDSADIDKTLIKEMKINFQNQCTKTNWLIDENDYTGTFAHQ